MVHIEAEFALVQEGNFQTSQGCRLAEADFVVQSVRLTRIHRIEIGPNRASLLPLSYPKMNYGLIFYQN